MPTTKPKPHDTRTIEFLIRDIVRGYTTDHGDIELTTQELTTTVMISLRGSANDHRRLVGSRGRHVWSLQRIAGLCGARIGKSVRLSLLEPKDGDRGPDLGFTPVENWDSGPFMLLFRRTIKATAPEGTTVKAAHAGHNTTLEVTMTAIGSAFREFAQSLQALFFAIGKMQGRVITVTFIGPEGSEVAYEPI